MYNVSNVQQQCKICLLKCKPVHSRRKIPAHCSHSWNVVLNKCALCKTHKTTITCTENHNTKLTRFTEKLPQPAKLHKQKEYM